MDENVNIIIVPTSSSCHQQEVVVKDYREEGNSATEMVNETRSLSNNDVNTTSSIENNSTQQQSVIPHTLYSLSETACYVHKSWNAPLYMKWIEYPFRVRDCNDRTKPYLPEATGWAMDSVGRGVLNQMGGFVGSAILQLATKDVGCIIVTTTSSHTCTNTLPTIGLKPSSLLTATSAIVGIVCAIIMPIAGAIVDHTPYRKEVCFLSAIICISLTGLETLLSEEKNNWLFILILDAFQTIFLKVHTTGVFAYLPDFTSIETSLSHYTSQFLIRQYIAQILYTILLIMSVKIFKDNMDATTNTTIRTTIFTSHVATGMAFGYGIIFMGYSWIFLFRKRLALSKVPTGQTLVTTGFVQVQQTTRTIWFQYIALRWFMISLLFSPEAGAGIVLSIVVSFYTIELGISGQSLAMIGLMLMIGICFGAVLSKPLSKRFNPLNAYRFGLLFIATSIGVAVAYIDSPDKINACYGFSVLFGFAMGCTYPCQRVLFCTLIPKGQETEMMGLFSFCSQIISWLPPLIVTIMNENGISLRFGMLVVAVFCIIAVITTMFMGNYEVAVTKASKDSEEKLQQLIRATAASGGGGGGDIATTTST